MSGAKRVCLDLHTLEHGLILQTERDAGTQFIWKISGFKAGAYF